MARRPSKHTRVPRPLNTARYAVKQLKGQVTFLVREVPAERALKVYLCPGCNTSIPVGVAHVVAWPEEPGLGYTSGLEQRRHWHQHCWRLNR